MVRAFGRRGFLRAGAGLAAGVVLGVTSSGTPVAAQATPDATSALPPDPSVPPGELHLLTSSDHWDPGVLRSLAADPGIAVRVTPLTDDETALADVRAGMPGLDMVSVDGLWIPEYQAAGLTQPVDLARVSVARELYAVARTMDLLQSPDGLLGYPWSWSPLQVVYDPARILSVPDSWELLVDRRDRGGVIVESQRTDLVLCAGVAIGAADPHDMTDAEMASAIDWLTQLKPNIRRIARQRSDVIQALASGECAMAISSLGAPDLVKDAGGPEVVAFVPKEGTIGSIEVEMVLAGAPDAARIPAYLDAAASAEASAAAFLSDGRPLFNERAYQLLVDSGHGARADRYLYDQPEVALQMTLTGPGARAEAYRAAAQVIFGDT